MLKSKKSTEERGLLTEEEGLYYMFSFISNKTK